jgi:hypothetical protein
VTFINADRAAKKFEQKHAKTAKGEKMVPAAKIPGG